MEKEKLPEGLHTFQTEEFNNLLDAYVAGFAKYVDKEMEDIQKNLEAIKNALSLTS